MPDGDHPGAAARADGTDRPARLGYCTNVHAGETLDATRRNLAEHAVAVRERLEGDAPLGVGLWLSARAARELLESDGVARFGAWLAERRLDVYTINGFPYGDFHDAVVKHAVYHPTWCDDARLAYTLDLARILAALRPDGDDAGISTLPIGWARDVADAGARDRASANLRRAVTALARLHETTGRLIHLDLEPEPGCLLERSGDLASFFAEHLLGHDGREDARVRRHLRVCHDVCHAAVMFESQRSAFARYDEVGLAVGKVQVSSALHAPFDEASDADRPAIVDALAAFREPRYLHQTVEAAAEDADEAGAVFHEDLPGALAAWRRAGPPSRPCRVHFHVPVHLERIGPLRTTRAAIEDCLALLRRRTDPCDLEVETYAWGVLPPALREARLADGIAEELRWVRAAM